MVRSARPVSTSIGTRLWALLASPFGKIALAFLLFQGTHVAEHLVQVAQLRVLHLPKDEAHGIVSTFDNEWIHFSWNVVVFAVLAALAHLRAYRVLIFAALVSGLHLVEHGILLRQFLSTGVQGFGVFARGGILFGEDGALPRPELHLVYNTIEFIPVLVVVAAALLLPRARIPGRAGVWLRAWVGVAAGATLIAAMLPGHLVEAPSRGLARFEDTALGVSVELPSGWRRSVPGSMNALFDAVDPQSALPAYVRVSLFRERAAYPAQTLSARGRVIAARAERGPRTRGPVTFEMRRLPAGEAVRLEFAAEERAVLSTVVCYILARGADTFILTLLAPAGAPASEWERLEVIAQSFSVR